MKLIILLIFCCFFISFSYGQSQPDLNKPDSSKKIAVVETACGQCQFGLPGDGCDLAVRINGQAYFVDGTSIDEHGDAHSKDGFCNAIRTAEVQGDVSDNRFKVSYFKLLPKKPIKETKE